jgi:hypothetical protein
MSWMGAIWPVRFTDLMPKAIWGAARIATQIRALSIHALIKGSMLRVGTAARAATTIIPLTPLPERVKISIGTMSTGDMQPAISQQRIVGPVIKAQIGSARSGLTVPVAMYPIQPVLRSEVAPVVIKIHPAEARNRIAMENIQKAVTKI